MIPESTIDKLSNLSIVEVAKKLDIKIVKAGANYKAPCPLHSEKTASFTVSPALNIFNCFGCGAKGGTIAMVQQVKQLPFLEACRWLANEFKITIKFEEPSPQAIAERKVKDEVKIANAHAQRYFAQHTHPQAEQRWNEEQRKQWGIGFAPDEWQGLMNYATKQALAHSTLEQAELISTSDKGKKYDFFRNRITFPIHNIIGDVVGFTARAVDDSNAKYINSRATVLFDKGATLYGLFFAKKAIMDAGFAYIVEGTPDVIKMHSVGATNTVAPLGTSFTKQHFEVLKRFCTRVCLVLETDNAGVAGVMKTAKEAYKHGFTVQLLALPEETDDKGRRIKTDPDSFFTTAQHFDAYIAKNTHIYIEWLANRTIFNNGIRNEDAIYDICELMSYLQDTSMLDKLYYNLAQIMKPRSMWVKKVEQIKREREIKIISQDKIKEEMIEDYGFYIEDNQPMFYGRDQRYKPGANFILEPKFHVISVNNSKRLYNIINIYNNKKVIELKQDEIINLSKFKVRVESLGNFVWFVGEPELNRYKAYLYNNTKTCTEIEQMGWQRQGFWAWCNGIYADGQFKRIDSDGIVKYDGEHYYLPAESDVWRDEHNMFQFERKFKFSNLGTISMYDYSSLMIEVFGSNAMIGLCFLFSCLFHDVIFSLTKFFPILNGFGPKGAGKSAMGISLSAFFTKKNVPPNINNSTIPALADVVGQSANTLVHIDEYKNMIDIIKSEFLKGLWDGSGRTRMNMDRDKKRETTSVDCGIYLSGQEMPTIDIALFSRLLFITFTQTEYSDEEKARFNKLRQVEEEGLAHLTHQVLNARQHFKTNFEASFKVCSAMLSEKLGTRVVEDRLFRNWLVPLATFHCLQNHIEVSFTFNQLTEVIVEKLINQNAETKRNNELSNFWSIVEYLVKDGLLENEIDYHIKSVINLKTDIVKETMYKHPKRVLFINRAKVFQLYRKHGKVASDKVLPVATLEYYLQNSKEYLGIKSSVAFKNRDVVTKQIIKEEKMDGFDKKTSHRYQVTRAMAFDYDMLNIDIDYVNISDSEVNTDIDEVKPFDTEAPLEAPY